MNSELRIASVVASHEGCVRTNNEDSFCDRPEQRLWAVADGMGGHESGEWASAAIVDSLAAVEMPDDFRSACHVISDAIHRANTVIWEEATRRGKQMGSTVVALHVNGSQFAVLWVGDSRAYLVRQGLLHRLTRDHTQVQELVDRGLLDEADAADHPMSHVLARAVGVQSAVSVEGIADETEPGDIFLLCSDGLTGQVADEEIRTILTANGQAAALARLIELTLERGAPDNVTVAIAGVSEATLLSFATPMGVPQP